MPETCFIILVRCSEATIPHCTTLQVGYPRAPGGPGGGTSPRRAARTTYEGSDLDIAMKWHGRLSGRSTYGSWLVSR